MPVITSLAWSAASSFGHALFRAVWRAVKFIEQTQHRRAAQMLSKLDDRMLADIGLTRSDLRDAYAVSPWKDPTSLLRARALERRLARHGISHGLAAESVVAPPLAPKVDAAAVSQARVTFSKCS